MRNVAIILSGGKGKRLGTDIPKQYIEIGDQPLLAFSLIAFEKSLVDEIVIVAAPEYIERCSKIAEAAGISKLVAVVAGGIERYDSVWEGLKFFKDRYNLNQNSDRKFKGYNEDNARKFVNDKCHGNSARKFAVDEYNGDNTKKFTVDKYYNLTTEAGYYQENNSSEEGIVLIHDGARPFIKTSVINEVLKEVELSGAAIAAVPCTDTIKIADEEGFISSTTERRFTWSAQTPQGFCFDYIYEAYRYLLEGQQFRERSLTGAESSRKSENDDCCNDLNPGITEFNTDKGFSRKEKSIQITDDAMVYQIKYPERRVKLVMAGQDNIKITTSKDLILAENLLRR